MKRISLFDNGPLKILFLGLMLLSAVFLMPQDLLAKKKTEPAQASTKTVSVTARPIDGFHRSGFGSQRYGKLHFLGGLVLRSSWDGFGGWSDIVVERDGRRFLAVSDDGHWLRGNLEYKGLKPVGVSKVSRGEFQALSGRVLRRKRERDAEGAALLSGSLEKGSLLISFERIHRIGKFQVRGNKIFGPTKYLKLPREARSLWRNKGIESVGVLRGGRFKGAVIAIAERRRGSKQKTKKGSRRPGWILKSGRATPFFIRDRGDMDITSVAGLANGDLILLERRFRWSEGMRIRLRRILAKDLRAGAEVDGDVLMEVGLDHEVDNMEGLAVHRGPEGETILTLISDDNFNKLLQRTILLQFKLDESTLRAGVEDH